MTPLHQPQRDGPLTAKPRPMIVVRLAMHVFEMATRRGEERDRRDVAQRAKRPGATRLDAPPRVQRLARVLAMARRTLL